MNLKPNQKIEIAHDILAREVYARIDAAEKMRLKAAQFLRDRYEYYQTTQVLLDKKDLNYLSPYLERVQLSPEQALFINESRREVGAKARRMWRRTLAAAVVMAAAAAVAVFFWWRAARAFDELKEAKKMYVDKLIENANNLIQECRGEEALSVLHDANDVLASHPSLEKAYKNLADEGVNNSERWFQNLRYDDALVVLNFSKEAGKDPKLLKKPYFEIIYVYGETHQFDKAVRAWSQAHFGKAGPAFSAQKDTLLQIRETLRQIDAGLYKEMQARYYPDMVLVPGGTFKMGCEKGRGQECRDSERQHTVKVDSFWMAQTETTVWQYFLYTKARGNEQPKGAGGEPVAFVNWFDGVEYANWLSRQFGKEEAIWVSKQFGKEESASKEEYIYQVNLRSSGFRLPTEAEWEYAAKEGRQKQAFVFSGSNVLDSVGWYNDNSGLKASPVAEKAPNELGLYDMSGNLWEWCWDWAKNDYYDKSPGKNPKGPASGTLRALRGGSWGYGQDSAQCFRRDKDDPNRRGDDYGFRLARTAGTE